MAHGSHQLAFPARPTWGGRRAGAGRKPAPGRRPGVAHATDHLHLIVEADDRSSAPWFTGWRNALATLPGPPPVVGARTWLAAVGWRRHGLIDGATECPRTKRPCRKAHHGHLDRYLPRQEDR